MQSFLRKLAGNVEAQMSFTPAAFTFYTRRGLPGRFWQRKISRSGRAEYIKSPGSSRELYKSYINFSDRGLVWDRSQSHRH